MSWEKGRELKNNHNQDGWWSVFLIFFKLGLTSFGGPIAHIGYFRTEFVENRKWLSDAQFTELVSICHFLPGPASSQLGMALGLRRAGTLGSFSAWAGFTAPSALIMLLCGIGIFSFETDIPRGLIHGLKLVAVAVVAQALIGMVRSLTPDLPRAAIACVSCAIVLFLSGTLFQPFVILFGALCGVLFLKSREGEAATSLDIPIGLSSAKLCLILFSVLLLALPFLAGTAQVLPLQIADIFYRAGSLVFGGGHVVLPLLSAETVGRGIISEDLFLAGYGAAQALPGPLFTFASYLGAIMSSPEQIVLCSVIALLAIFAPAFLLVFGVLPFWEKVKQKEVYSRTLKGVNASVVGLLAAALYMPLWTSSIQGLVDIGIVILAFCALMAFKCPPWIVVILAALSGWFLL